MDRIFVNNEQGSFEQVLVQINRKTIEKQIEAMQLQLENLPIKIQELKTILEQIKY